MKKYLLILIPFFTSCGSNDSFKEKEHVSYKTKFVVYFPNVQDTNEVVTKRPLEIYVNEGSNYLVLYNKRYYDGSVYESTAPIKILSSETFNPKRQ